MTVAELAAELGLKSRELAEAIDVLSKCVTAGDVLEAMDQVEKLRRQRDRVAEKYRAAVRRPEQHT